MEEEVVFRGQLYFDLLNLVWCLPALTTKTWLRTVLTSGNQIAKDEYTYKYKDLNPDSLKGSNRLAVLIRLLNLELEWCLLVKPNCMSIT